MEEFLNFLKPTSAFQVISSTGILLLCITAFFGRVKRFKMGNVEIDLNDKTTVSNTVVAELYTAIKTNKEHISELVNKIDVIKSELSEFRLDQLKAFSYDKDQRADERLLAGLRYVEKGGNGEVKKDVVSFAKDNRQIYDANIRIDKLLQELKYFFQ